VTAPPGAAPRVMLLSRPGCHLCEQARAVIERVTAELGVGWEERDVDASPADRAAYSDMVPVIFVDGVQHDFWRISEHRLRTALGAGPRGTAAPG
jgi:glutaredoxin